MKHRKAEGNAKLGVGRFGTLQQHGNEYVSVTTSAPEFGTIYSNLANVPGDDPRRRS